MQNQAKEPARIIPGPDTMDAMLDLVDNIIRTEGHVIQIIKGGEDEPPFGYTVGLHESGWPEIIIIGTEQASSHAVLNAVITYLRKSDRRPVDGMVISGITEYPLRLQAVRGQADPWIIVATRRAKKIKGSDRVEVLQLIWADENGKYPGEEGCIIPEAYQFQI